MKVDVNLLNPGVNGSAALTLVVALLDALQSSATMSATEVQHILAEAKSLLLGDHNIAKGGRGILDSIEI